jgi:hypothetical protein
MRFFEDAVRPNQSLDRVFDLAWDNSQDCSFQSARSEQWMTTLKRKWPSANLGSFCFSLSDGHTGFHSISRCVLTAGAWESQPFFAAHSINLLQLILSGWLFRLESDHSASPVVCTPLFSPYTELSVEQSSRLFEAQTHSVNSLNSFENLQACLPSLFPRFGLKKPLRFDTTKLPDWSRAGISTPGLIINTGHDRRDRGGSDERSQFSQHTGLTTENWCPSGWERGARE